MAKTKSKAGWWFLLIALAAGGGGYYWWTLKRKGAAAIEYRTATIGRGDIVQTVSANGQISPLITVQVGSQVSGNVLKLYADFNSKVTNGQLIAELDPATYEARLVQADNELANAKAQQTLARVNAKRARELFQNKLISGSDYDQTVAELEQRDATVRIREAAVKSAQVDYERTKIHSPIDGTVISRNVDVGQTVQASFTAPTLFNIANDLQRMEIAAMVSEADIGGVEENQEVSFTVEAFPARTFRGRVSQVRNQPTTNQNVVTYATIIDVRNSDLKLKPGMTATVSITTAKKENAIRIPNAALRFRAPEGAVIITNQTQLASSGGGPNRTAAEPAAASPAPADDGLPEFPGGFQPSPEMRQRMIARYDKDGDGRLNEEERSAFQEAMRARAAGGGGGGPGGEGGPRGGGGGSGRSRGESQPFRTLYLAVTNTASALKPVVELHPVRVKTGISDGSFTEALEGLNEKDVLAVGVVASKTAAPAAPANNPFGGPFGGPRR